MRGRKEELMQLVSNIQPFVVDLYGLEDNVVVYGLLLSTLVSQTKAYCCVKHSSAEKTAASVLFS